MPRRRVRFTQSKKLSDGSRMTYTESYTPGELLMRGCLMNVFKGIWWCFRLVLYGWIVWPIKYFRNRKKD